MDGRAGKVAVVTAILSLSSIAARATLPGLGSCGSPDNVNCVPVFVNGNWAALRRAADLSNGELACYDPANTVQSDGMLSITLRQESQTCAEGSLADPVQRNYTSDMIMSYPFNFLYGTVEARIKFGRGWPALWLLGGNATAQTGCQVSNILSAESIFSCDWDSDASDSAEIDIAEFYESDNGGAYNWAGHNMFSNGGHSCGQPMPSGNAYSDFHVYSMTWTPGEVTFAVDGVPANCSHTGSAVPSHPMFIIINDTLSQTNNSIPPSFPQVTTIDYVKVTDMNNQVIFFDDFAGAPPTPPPTSTPTATATPTSPPTPLTCGSASQIASARLVISNNGDPPADERLSLRGAWQLATLTPAIDPSADGFGFDVLDQNGAVIFSRRVPAGLAPNQGAAGWRVSGRGRRWRFSDRTGSVAGGITRVSISQPSADVPGEVRFSVRGRGSNFHVAASQVPVQAVIVLGGATQAAVGQCATAAFNATGGPRPACQLSPAGDALKCR